MTVVRTDRRKTARKGDPLRRGRRLEPRACVLLAGSAEALSGHKRVTLLDVSVTGARIEGADLPAVGREIILKCGPVDTFGVIAWSASNRCGVQFDAPLEPSRLVSLRHMAAQAVDSAMSVEERQAAEDWCNGLAR